MNLLVRKVASEIPLLDEIPLFGNAPPFDFEQLSLQLGERLGSSVQVRPKEMRWRETSALKEGLGSNPLVTSLSLLPLSSPLFWAMAQPCLQKLTSWALSAQEQQEGFSSEVLQEAFYRYLLLEGLDALSTVRPFQELTFALGEESDFPKEGAFCIDLELSSQRESCWGRLIVPELFRKEWISHFAHIPSEYVPTSLARQTELIVGIKTGALSLSQEEWGALKPGDFLPLESGYDARTHQGTALLMLGTAPLFQLKIKQNRVELLDYALYYEETMEEQSAQNLEVAGEPLSSVKETALNITVEIARLKISLNKLMQLIPGNTLELPIHPEQGVALTVNGQKVGRAELVHLGEKLGIRILEMG